MRNDPANGKGKRWRPTRSYIQRIEEHAMILRQSIKIGEIDRLDPHALASELRLQFVDINGIDGLSPEHLQGIHEIDAGEWSGISRVLPDGYLLVALNPNMTIERENVTIMEEVAHVYYRHAPTRLLTYPSGFEKREYDEAVEREAYWTAAAVLLPSKAVGLAVYRRQAAEDLAVIYGTSVELAEMRIKTLRLWPHYHPSTLPLRRAS